MRTAKYRAWNPKLRVMTNCVSVYSETDGSSWWSADIINPDNDNKIFSFEDGELMEFTGLLDKNGKEIYESDVLNHKTTFENNMADRRFQSRTEVLAGFENGCFIDSFTKVSLHEKIYSIVEHKIDFEVIGNIHEIPELLK